MKRLIIINPKSKNGRSFKHFKKMEPNLRELLGSYDLYTTTAMKDCTKKVRETLLQNNYDQILIAGGDGSVNEAINGYFQDRKCIQTKIPIGIINLGTGGDFIKSVKLKSKDYNQALKDNTYQMVDCGITGLKDMKNSHYFINISSVGMAGDINLSLKNSPFQYGIFAYFYHTLKILIKYKAPDCTIRVKNPEGNWEEITSGLMNFFACNGKYNGGGMIWAPSGDIQSGIFHFVLVGQTSKWKLLLDSHKVYSGNVAKMVNVTELKGTEVHIISKGRVSQEMDGEIQDVDYSNKDLEFHFKIIPSSIPMVI